MIMKTDVELETLTLDGEEVTFTSGETIYEVAERHHKETLNVRRTVRRTRETSVASSAVVRSPRLVHAPGLVSRYRWPGRIMASEGQPLGHDASHDHWASHRQ